MRRLVIAMSTIILATVGGALFTWTRFTSFLESPGSPGSPGSAPSEDKIVVVPSDATPATLTELFAKEGLISRADLMQVYFEHFSNAPQLKPGEYALSASMAPIELIRKIESGKVVTYSITIPPGARVVEIVKILAKKQLGDPKELMRLAFDKKLAGELGIQGDSLEGYLFPDVYELPRGLSGAVLLGQLVQRYRKTVTSDALEVAKTRGLTEHELITLASLIERAPILPTERRMYSALVHNRLHERQPLEHEASVDYGFERMGITPTAEDRDSIDHPWNTNMHPGLPPTPIASPGIASIVAASEPAQSAALFMVRRSDGTHVFCSDEDCYNAEVKRWHKDSDPAPKKKKKKKKKKPIDIDSVVLP